MQLRYRLDTVRAVRYSALDTGGALEALRADINARRDDAAWLRDAHQKHGSLSDVARRQSEEWMGSLNSA